VGWLSRRFELSRGGDAHNVRPMEGLRGLAVFLVFLVHYVTLVSPWLSEKAAIHVFARSLRTIGNTGVDLFFVLSGYLIYGSLISRDQRFVRFMSRRIQRIYPAFIVVFVIYVAMSLAFSSENKIPPGAVEGLIYLAQNFLLLPGLFPIEPMITVAWSLSYEVFFYLAIPLIIAALRLRDRGTVWRTLFFLCAAGLITVYCLAYGGHIRLVMFIAGILLYEAIDSPLVPTPSSLLSLVALAIGFLAVLVPLNGPVGSVLKANTLFVAFFLLCLTCLRNPSAWLPRAFSWTPLRWLGNMSYSYYLLHGLALKAAFLALSKANPGESFGSWFFWALLPPMFVLTLVPAAALFLLIERPFSLVPKAVSAREPQLPLELDPGSDQEMALRRTENA